MDIFNSNVDIIIEKTIGNEEDIELIKETLKSPLQYDYLLFLNEYKYIHLKKGNEEIVLFDPLTIIHENSIDILNNIGETLEFLCVGKFVNTDRYLIYKNGKEGYGLYDNKSFSKNKLSSSIEEFLNK